MASIVLDDSTDRLKTGGVEWNYDPHRCDFGGGSTWANVSVPPTKYGTFNISFEGTSIAFTGWVGTPFDSEPLSFLVSIDGSRPQETTYHPGSVAVHQWYQTPLLSDNAHVLNVSRFPDNIEIDYMVVTAGRQTPLLGERLIVDDVDPAIIYHGQWSYQDFSPYQTNDDGDSVLLYPHANGTHKTTTPGSGATFHFIGTLVSVYGIFNWNAPCNMSVMYVVDNASFTKNYTVIGTPFYNDRSGIIGHTLLFASDPLPAGEHTLSFELVKMSPDADSNDFSLALDYILYSPSFGSLAELGSYRPTGTTTAPTAVVPTIAPSAHSRKVAVIVGSVVGGLIALVLLLLVIFRKRFRSWQSNFRIVEGDPVVQMDMPVPRNPSLTPFTFLESTTVGIQPTLKDPYLPGMPPAGIPPPHPLLVPILQVNSTLGQAVTTNEAQDTQPFGSPYSRNPALKQYIREFATRQATVSNGGSAPGSPPPGYQARSTTS